MKTFAALVLSAVLVALPTTADAVVLGRGHLDYGYQIEGTKLSQVKLEDFDLAESDSPVDLDINIDNDDDEPEEESLAQVDDHCDCDDDDDDGDDDDENDLAQVDDDRDCDDDDDGDDDDENDLAQIKHLLAQNQAKVVASQNFIHNNPVREKNTMLAGSARIP